MKFLKRLTWDVWIIGPFAIDFTNKTAGVCIGPWAGWIKWGLSKAEQLIEDLKIHPIPGKGFDPERPPRQVKPHTPGSL